MQADNRADAVDRILILYNTHKVRKMELGDLDNPFSQEYSLPWVTNNLQGSLHLTLLSNEEGCDQSKSLIVCQA